MSEASLPKTDKEQRLHTAGLLLDQVRRNGGTAKELAAYLGISPTTVSHWQSDDPKRRQRVAAPSDIQLQRLVGYLCYLAKKNLQSLEEIASGYRLRTRERLLFLGAMRDAFVEQAKWWTGEYETTQSALEELIAKLREHQEERGPAGIPLELLRSIYNLSGLPEPDDLERGEVNWDRICPPREWSEQFIKSMMLGIDGFMIDQEERKAAEEGLLFEPEDPQPEDPAE